MSGLCAQRSKLLAHPPSQSVVLRLMLAAALLLISASGVPPPPDIPQPLAAAIQITGDQAVSAALNQLSATESGYRMQNPRFQAQFTASGVSFALPGEALDWQWRLEYLGAEGGAALALQALRPVEREQGVVAYPRLGWEERYIPGSQSIEQQFVLHQPLPLGGRDLVIAGRVQSAGEFSEVEDGWLWVSGESSVWMSGVRVYDALGTDIPATMEAWQDGTRILVDGLALEQAVYPVTVDPEIGPGDFRISQMGILSVIPSADVDLAYNSTTNEYLVVFSTNIFDGNGWEVYARRVNAVSGEVIGAEVRISDMGPDGSNDYSAYEPAVAYNSTRDEYLVVWEGDDNIAPLVDGEYEIFGQRVSGQTGQPVGANDFRLSSMGPNGDVSYDASRTDVAWNATNNEYLVVWDGAGDIAIGADDIEIYAQRVDGTTGAELGGDERISFMWDPDGFDDALYDAYLPAVAWNSLNNQYLVAWSGDSASGSLVDGEYEIWGQRLDGPTGDEVEADFRISDMGPDGDAAFDSDNPDVAYNSTDNQYLVVWQGDDNSGTLVDNEDEIFGQRLSALGEALGTNDFRISEMGPNGDTNYTAYLPAVTFSGSLSQYLVVWVGDDINDLYRVFGQRLSAAGAALGANDFQISQSAPNTSLAADSLSVAYNPSGAEYLVVWSEYDDVLVFGQRLDAASGAEEGENDFGIFSFFLDTLSDAYDPRVAYDSTHNQYLVVWSGDDAWSGEDGKFQIYGQRVDDATGELLGNRVELSEMGPDNDVNYDALAPAVTYNITDDDFYVVWSGDDDAAGLVDNEDEIWGQRVNAYNGVELGDDVQLSDMGGSGNASYDASYPAVIYNHTSNEYLVVWEADEISGALVDNEYEIFGQRITAATGAPVGTNDFRISSMGPDGNGAYDAGNPSVAWNSDKNQYLVVWQGDDNTAPLVDGETEIFAHRLNSTGGSLGSGEFRISDMGPDGNTIYDAGDPVVAYGAVYEQYLVVWQGDDNTGALVDGELDIYGQLVDSIGYEAWENDFRISQVGSDGAVGTNASEPDVVYNPVKAEFLVVWYADLESGGLGVNEYEIYGQRLNGTRGTQMGINDFRLSDMGLDGDNRYGAFSPAAACHDTEMVCLVVWYGDDNRVPLIVDELEVFGQLYNLADTIYLPRVAK